MPRPRLSGWRAPSAILAVVLAALLLVSTIALAQPVALVDAPPPPSPAPAYTGPTSPSLAVELHHAVEAARASDAWYAAVSTPPPAPPSSSPVARARRDSSTPAAPDSSGPVGYPCGGDLPPCWVLDRESGYNDGDPYTYDIHAYNPTGCGGRGCYGKWQCDPRSCDGTGTEAEQDASARALWDGGRGCSHWAACR